MTNKEYVENVLVTESCDMTNIKSRLQDENTIRLLHSFVGLATETAELQDAFKKHIFYGKPLDRVNLVEELGDLTWYIAVACDELGTSFEEIMEKNINKLKARYGDKFTENAALNRNTEKEYNVLKSSGFGSSDV